MSTSPTKTDDTTFMRSASTTASSQIRNDPFTKLQLGEALERRASRRFEAYHSAKIRGSLGGMSNDFQGRMRQPTLYDRPALDKSVAEATDQRNNTPSRARTSPTAESDETATATTKSSKAEVVNIIPVEEEPAPVPVTFSVFLQIEKQVKKAIVSKSELSLSTLRYLFIDRFQYSPVTETLPLYIRDKTSDIEYELEEVTLCDVADGSLIILRVPDTRSDEKPENKEIEKIKTAFDGGIGSILEQLAVLQEKVNSQNDTITRIASDQALSASQIQELAKSLETATMVAPTTPTDQATSPANQPKPVPVTSVRSMSQTHLAEISSLRNDLASIRQIHTSIAKDFDSSLEAVKDKVIRAVDSHKTSVIVPGSKLVEKYHDVLSNDVDNLLTRVEKLQDDIEVLRRDVALRRVRPLPRHLETINKEIAETRSELDRLENYVKNEKPIWTKILERELDNIAEEQEFFTLQEDLLGDLLSDLGSVGETFSLVQQFTEEQLKNPQTRLPTGYSNSSFSSGDMLSGKDAVLKEVRALNPNHQGRVEAIERAEKMRQLIVRPEGEFEKQLQEFVDEGKLKKSGGIEEVERKRKQREEQVWKEWSENNLAMSMNML
ncbi:actin interacting protein 3-domain-containing protein [Limtongia smithiae]|uniref:actin interacting protein 3-domain-containing protein n=1 Tax=Limtongia smithiae TaxID=1125753 RepID=UPI0034CFBB85